MVLLLAVGLAAVIIVILIAVFLSVRLGRSDDREEPAGRSSERSEGRADADDSRWRDERAPRRSSAGAARRATRPPRQGTTTTRSGRPGATTRGQWSSRPIPGGWRPGHAGVDHAVAADPAVTTAPSAPEPGAVGPRPRPRPTTQAPRGTPPRTSSPPGH